MSSLMTLSLYGEPMRVFSLDKTVLALIEVLPLTSIAVTIVSWPDAPAGPLSGCETVCARAAALKNKPQHKSIMQSFLSMFSLAVNRTVDAKNLN